MGLWQVAAELALCRECKAVSPAEREELILRGKFTEESSNITCSFYAFRKLRLTRNGYLMVDGYLDPVKDPTPTDIALWVPDRTKTPDPALDLAKIKYILGLIGDQFCTMVQQERKCFSLHMGPNKAVTWKRAVRGVREMCDVCKTTLFNHHWICGMCGMFVCLDCYQFRRGGLVKDKTIVDRSTDDYKWPYCTTGRFFLQRFKYRLLLCSCIANYYIKKLYPLPLSHTFWKSLSPLHRYCSCKSQKNL